MSTEYLTENQVLKIVLNYFGLDEDDPHVLCQWQVDKDGGFDGILIRNNDSEFMRKVRELQAGGGVAVAQSQTEEKIET